MKTPALDLAPVTAGREALASVEAHLVAMRERLEVARQLVDTREKEQQACEAARRQVVISGEDDEPAVRALTNARILSEDARERLALLTAAVTEAEDSVLGSEAELLLALDVARQERYEETKKALVDAILKYGPPFRVAAQATGQAWWHTGQMLGDVGERFVAAHWRDAEPVAELAKTHKSSIITEERRGPPR